MTDRKPDVIGVHRERQLAMLDTGALVPVKHWLDTQGEFCSPTEAVACVAGNEEMGWWAIDLTAYTGRPH